MQYLKGTFIEMVRSNTDHDVLIDNNHRFDSHVGDVRLIDVFTYELLRTTVCYTSFCEVSLFVSDVGSLLDFGSQV